MGSQTHTFALSNTISVALHRWWTLVNPNQRVKQDQDSSRESIYRKLFSVQVCNEIICLAV